MQNKLLYAVTRHTAAEIIIKRANEKVPNMGLTTWSGNRVRKQDVIVAKNYLSADEVDTLNRLVVILLEQAELRVKQQQQLTLDYWRNNVDRLLEFNNYPVLQGVGNDPPIKPKPTPTNATTCSTPNADAKTSPMSMPMPMPMPKTSGCWRIWRKT